MSVARNSFDANPWGSDAVLGTGSDKPGARVYRSKSDPNRRTSFFFGCKTRKDDLWWWENRAKPGYVRSILRQLVLSSGLLSFKEAKLSVGASKSSTSIYRLYSATDKSPGQNDIPWSDPSTAGNTTARVCILTKSEWKYWQRRIRRDREQVAGIDTVYTIPQQDGTIAVVTVAAYTLIPGRNHVGEKAIEKALSALLDTHDRSRPIRGNWGSQKTTDRKNDSDMIWDESTLLTAEEFTDELKALKKEEKIISFNEHEHGGNLRHNWEAADGYENEIRKRLQLVPRKKKTS